MTNDDLYKVIEETINYLKDYYLDWQDYIERFSFPRMDYYYLLINISSFYEMLKFALKKLEIWKKTNEEIDLVYVFLCIPSKIIFSSSIYNNFVIIKKYLDYNDEVFELLLKENEKDQKAD